MLLLKEKATGEWFPPAGRRREGEPMATAAERVLRAAFGGNASLDAWFVGNAPVGAWLRVYPAALAAERGCYGEKVFFYRAELLAGRFRLPAATAGGEDGRDAATFGWSDFSWVTRDESEPLLTRPLYKFFHQIVGAGAGEEASRNKRWREGIAAKGLTIAQATGRRAYRRAQVAPCAAPPRLRLVATRADAHLAAEKCGVHKVSQLAQAVDALHARRRAEKARAAELRAVLSNRPAFEKVRAELAAARAARGVGGNLGGVSAVAASGAQN